MKVQLKNKQGFTIIEVMIVLTIASLIMVILFVAVPQASVSRRDSQRKAYANSVFQAVEEYYKNSGHFLDPSNTSNDRPRFLVDYMPPGSDPSTGKSFGMASVGDIKSVPHGETNPAHSVVIYDYGIQHKNAKPKVGQVVIATGHICQNAHPDSTGLVLSDVAFTKQHIADVFAVIVYQEHGQYYCIDNYQDDD
jgi:prepilin-type N-terminal cleavage/methylation domain-containing protein